MIYLTNNSTSVYFPSPVDFGEIYKIVCTNQVTHKAITLDLATYPTYKDGFYIVAFDNTMLSKFEVGQYDYELIDAFVKPVVTGILQYGDYTPSHTDYNNNLTEIIQYNG